MAAGQSALSNRKVLPREMVGVTRTSKKVFSSLQEVLDPVGKPHIQKMTFSKTAAKLEDYFASTGEKVMIKLVPKSEDKYDEKCGWVDNNVCKVVEETQYREVCVCHTDNDVNCHFKCDTVKRRDCKLKQEEECKVDYLHIRI